MSNKLERRTFTKLLLLSSNGFALDPLPWLAQQKKLPPSTPPQIQTYSIKGLSLTEAQLLFNERMNQPADKNYILPTPKEFLITGWERFSSEADLDDAFSEKVQEIDNQFNTYIQNYALTSSNIDNNRIDDLLSITKKEAIENIPGRSPAALPIVAVGAAKYVGGAIASGIIGGAAYDFLNGAEVTPEDLKENEERITSELDEIKLRNEEHSRALKEKLDDSFQQTIRRVDEAESNLGHQLEEYNQQEIDRDETIQQKVEEGKRQTRQDHQQTRNTITDEAVQTREEITNVVLASDEQTRELINTRFNYVEKYMFLNMPPELQQKALASDNLGFIQGLEPNEREELRQKVDTAVAERKETREFLEFKDKLEKGQALIGETYSAALALGLKGEAAEIGAKVVDWAGQAVGIAISFASSNPYGYAMGALQTISLVGSMFGGDSGPDPVAQRLAQISQQIQDLHQEMVKGFTQLDKKLDKLAELNVELYNNLYEAIENQTQFLQNWFEYLAESQEGILNRVIKGNCQVLIIGDQMDESLRRNFNILKGVELDRRMAINQGSNPNYLVSYEDLVRVARPAEFQTAISGLNEIITSIYINDISIRISASATDFGPVCLEFYRLREVYQPALDVFNIAYPVNSSSRDVALNSLIFSLEKCQDCPLVYDRMKPISDALGIEYQCDTLPNEELNPSAIVEFVNYYLAYSIFFIIYRDQNTYAPYATFDDYLALEESEKKDRRASVLNRINKLIKVTNQAIAQRSLMSGHTLLDKIENIFVNQNTSLSDDAKKALTSNYLLSSNYIKYLLYPKLHLLTEYDTAYHAKDATALKSLIGMNVSERQKADNNFELIADYHGVKLILPTAEEIEKNEMTYPRELYQLFNARDRLIQKKIDLEFGNVFA